MILNFKKNKINKVTNINELDYKCANNIKTLALDMIEEANSGHSGIVMSAGNIIYTIYAKQLIFDKNNPNWINRDRFVLSCGHASALLYSTLYMCGFLNIDDLKEFRKINSKTPGHPEITTQGVEVSTGVLGEGFANAVGMAIAEKYLNNRYKYNKSISLIDHYTYCLVSDGDLMEGISYEAAALAGNLSLNKLIVLYDSNENTSDNDTKNTFKENILDRFKSQNWSTIKTNNTIEDINNSIELAKASNKPTIIEIKTILGEYTKYENKCEAHSKVLTKEEIKKIKKKLNIRDIPFSISQDAHDYFNKEIDMRCNKKIKEYIDNFNKIYPKIIKEYQKELDNLKENKNEIIIPEIEIKKDGTQREISRTILEQIMYNNELIIGGSCDLSKSTGTNINLDKFTKENSEGRIIDFGIREHSSAAILNGLALSNIIPFVSTMLVFSDHMKPSIRMSALMNLKVLYIFSHDSFLLGEDGATHQPIEQLVSLRSIPNLNVYRPFDRNEILGAYKSALEHDGPSVIIISKNEVESSKYTNINDVSKGAYIVKNNNSNINIISSGYELQLALNIEKRLKEDNILVNVISMVSQNKFEKESEKYKEKIIPSNSKNIIIEYSSSNSWYKYVGNDRNLFTINHFGKSGNKNDLQKEFELDEETIYKKIKENLS